MQRHRLLAGIAAVVLMIPAATAYGANQDVQVHVLPTDTLALSVDGWADFGGLELNQKGHFDYWMNITNTTSNGWQIDVTGDDLYPFHWENCNENGCWNPIIDPGDPIAKSNLFVTGGDLPWWDDPDTDAVKFFTENLMDSPVVVVQATAAAHGEFGLDQPQAYLELTIPGTAQPGQQYHTTLTYTITSWNPTP